MKTETGRELVKHPHLDHGYNILYRGRKLGCVYKDDRTWTAIIVLGKDTASQICTTHLNVGEGFKTRREAVREIELSIHAENREWDIERELNR